MQANTLRKLFLDFFKSKGHIITESASMIVKNDPTLMFTNAGMNQFKSIFIGEEESKHLRIANSQKCLRVSGKHNDIEEVGHDTYHHTMFEMLGSWSFGDYFKEAAISWAWEFLVDVCNLDEDRIYVTVFEGSNTEKLEKDFEAFNFWKKYLPEDRILNGSKKDNFWEMGEVGPCGPCTEIHFDNRIDIERSKVKGSLLVNKDHPQVIEIWNIVFMQYNRCSDRSLALLPKYHVDTGMGLERLTMVMQGHSSNYDTDIFQPIITCISDLANVKYGQNAKQDIAMRVISDHIRAIVFSISDGQLPSNVKSGYVIRRLLRRASRYAYTFLNLKDKFMYKLVPVLTKQMAAQFNELKDQIDLIQKVIKEEEESFLRTLAAGLKRINQITKNNDVEVSGKLVFELYDTYGFPADLTDLILRERNLSFNKLDFESAMNQQKERSKQAGRLVTGDWVVLVEDDVEEFVGYTNLEIEIKITRYREVSSQDRLYYQLVFNITPFYPEGGGQVGDTGLIQNLNERVKIIDTKKENKLIVHFTESLPKDIDKIFTAKVNSKNRIASSRNHTATHLLQESLKNFLGDHVIQKGSLVNPNHLRFDFTHFSKIDTLDLKKIEEDVNAKILSNIALKEYNNLPISKAKKSGAIMLFGEKYDDVVRMIQFNTSKELCGGTHVNSTGEIGLFKIISEASTSAGIRRIEAITGQNVLKYLNDQESLLSEMRGLIKNKDLKEGVEQLVFSNKHLVKKLADLKKISLNSLRQEILGSIIKVNNIQFIAKEVEMEAEDMKTISYQFRKENNLVMVLASKSAGKVLLSVMITDDLIAQGMDSVVIIKEISKEINGGGGGQSFFAIAGGSNIDGINNAFKKAKQLVR